MCKKDIPPERKFKNTCCDDCHTLKIKEIDRRAYAAKMLKDPDYAKKQSAKQYARVKSDPEKMQQWQDTQRRYRQSDKGKMVARKSNKKYKQRNKQKISDDTKNYRAMLGNEWYEQRRKHEQKRLEKRKVHRAWLKENDPQAYNELREKERLYERRHLKNKRLNQTQIDFSSLLGEQNND